MFHPTITIPIAKYFTVCRCCCFCCSLKQSYLKQKDKYQVLKQNARWFQPEKWAQDFQFSDHTNSFLVFLHSDTFSQKNTSSYYFIPPYGAMRPSHSMHCIFFSVWPQESFSLIFNIIVFLKLFCPIPCSHGQKRSSVFLSRVALWTSRLLGA